ncbi:hypothetical protein [Ottowia oryzae]
MNDMPYRYLTPPAAAPGNAAERFFGRLMSLMVWTLLATMGVVLALSLLVWLAVMVVTSLIASVFTGRPAAVTVLWRRYRDMTRGLARQGWRKGEPASATPRADANGFTGAAPTAPTAVQDVGWREVKAPAPDTAGRTPSHP